MTSKTHLIIPDCHAHPDHDNSRADLLGKLILDLRPDVVVNIGDMWDFPSLAEYDKGKKSFWNKSYKKDLDAGLDFDERIWSPIRKSKQKMPMGVFCEGNHEYRLKRVLEVQTNLDGVIDFKDLQLERNYDHVIPYNGSTPGIIEVDGIHYAHYFVSGVMGRPIGGEHPAYSLLTKEFVSCTCGHIHISDYSIRTTVGGRRIMGLVAGVYQDYTPSYAGEVGRLWWRGVIIKRNVEDGCYDPQWVSIDQLRKIYG